MGVYRIQRKRKVRFFETLESGVYNKAVCDILGWFLIGINSLGSGKIEDPVESEHLHHQRLNFSSINVINFDITEAISLWAIFSELRMEAFRFIHSWLCSHTIREGS
ncbi:hypothetical protein OIU79_020412 [Salix purpurea]|uniref:Uncharacterized protein n=1 Tax=Salix purpurea TaxID=77065 RepID=A0A9Q1AFS8_SALPP|nr:hypothetical protein OIU79_020412 [Salix purpurea]